MTEKQDELYYVKRWIIACSLLLVVVVCSGCAGSMDTRLPAHPKEKLVFVDTHTELCEAYDRLTPHRKCRPSLFGFARGYTIYLKTDFTTCMLNHERAHLWGWKHEGKNGSCGPWEIDPSWGRSARNYVEAGG